jgi:hypothetical protein
MISEYDDIKKNIKEIALSGEKIHSLLCYVDEVDEVNFTCNVSTADGLSVYEKVRLKEITDTIQKKAGAYLIPVQDSRVIIDLIGAGQAYVTMVSEVLKVVTVIKEVEFNISATGLNLKVEDVTFNVSAETLNIKNGDLALNISSTGMEIKPNQDVRLAITSSGLSLENTNASKDLKTILDNLLTFFSNEYQVQTAWGPSGPAMSTSADKLSQFMDDLDMLIVEGGSNAIS